TRSSWAVAAGMRACTPPGWSRAADAARITQTAIGALSVTPRQEPHVLIDTPALPTAEPTFAFLVHPRAQVAPDMARVWAPLGHLPEAALQWGLRHLPVPPQPFATVRRRDRDALAGHIIVVPV